MAISCLEQALSSSNDWKQRTTLDKDDLICLTRICLQSTVFKYNDQIYKQVHGTPMGSSISVTLAELTMQSIENEIFDNSPIEIKLWKRYVDDIITIIPKTRIDEFHNFINSINTNIQFEKELENHNTLPFLDLQIIRKAEGSLKFQVYRKPTHTNRYLDADSNCPMTHKTSVIRSLVDRAFNLCSSEYLESEIEFIKSTLISNGYKSRQINQIIRKKRNSINSSNLSPQTNNNDPQQKYISVPYIKGTYEGMGRLLKQKKNIILASK